MTVADNLFDASQISVDTSAVQNAVTDIPSSVGSFVGSYGSGNNENGISSSAPVDLSTMVRFYWDQPGSNLKFKVQQCWASKLSGALFSDTANAVQMIDNGCGLFDWVEMSTNPAQIRFPLFGFFNRFSA